MNEEKLIVYCPLCTKEQKITPTIDRHFQPTFTIKHACEAINRNFILKYINTPKLVLKPIQYFSENKRFSFRLEDATVIKEINEFLKKNYKKIGLLRSDFYDNLDRTIPLGQEYAYICKNVLMLLSVSKLRFDISYFIFEG